LRLEVPDDRGVFSLKVRLVAGVLEVALEAINQIEKHVVGIAVDGVGDVLLRDAVLLGQALQNLAQLWPRACRPGAAGDAPGDRDGSRAKPSSWAGSAGCSRRAGSCDGNFSA
jgi:hypothetical protein